MKKITEQDQSTGCDGCRSRYWVEASPHGSSRPGWGCLYTGGHAIKRCSSYQPTAPTARPETEGVLPSVDDVAKTFAGCPPVTTSQEALLARAVETSAAAPDDPALEEQSLAPFATLFDYPLYGFYRDGRIWSNVDQRFLDGHRRADGYCEANLKRRDGSYKKEYVHRVICAAFHGPAPESTPMALHKNDVKHDNNADNLYWGNDQLNTNDKEANGNVVRGSDIHSAKLDEETVVAIRSLVKRGVPHQAIADLLGVSQSCVTNATVGTTWSHVVSYAEREAELAKLRFDNQSLRDAQKVCEDCMSPTQAEKDAELARLRGLHHFWTDKLSELPPEKLVSECIMRAVCRDADLVKLDRLTSELAAANGETERLLGVLHAVAEETDYRNIKGTIRHALAQCR